MKRFRAMTKINLWISVFLMMAISGAALSSQGEPYPLEAWAKRADMQQVRISPDGNRIALLNIVSDTGNPILEVYNANDLSAKPFRMNADPMEITSVSWVTDDLLIFSARDKVRDKIDGWNQGVYERALGLLTLNKDPKKSSWKKIAASDRADSGSLNIVSTLPSIPNKILISARKSIPGTTGRQEFISTYYKYDVKTGRRSQITSSAGAVKRISFDKDGDPQFGSGYDGGKGEYLTYYREKGSKKWEIIHRIHKDSFEDWRPLGLDPEAPGNLLVLGNNGDDKTGLWSYNPKTKKHEELIYRRSDVDILVRSHTNQFTNGDEITAVRYRDGRKTKFVWFNGEEEALYNQLQELIPNSDRLNISRTRDPQTMLVSNSGPRDPGTYYLVKNGRIEVIGSSYPDFASDQLADVRGISYEARDGKKIPGWITVPNSKPPYPLVVLPHGGPFVREGSGFDPWAQLLANRGYMVLQPQYRGSKGYGTDFYTTAFINGGQGGYQMQDDKDDGALYLVEQGLVDPDRMMMFGWSYGGYAALIAASRTPQIYQCVIAGATVPNTNQQVNYYRNQMTRFGGAGMIEQIRMWDDSISPIKEVAKVNIPMLIVHGTVDQRTPPKAAREYIAAMEENGKEFKTVWLDGADHFSNTLFYRHKMTLYTAMTDYLKNDCFTDRDEVASN
jgi:dipeptidyl aminopeptidase/acylaminoacyl peptidase